MRIIDKNHDFYDYLQDPTDNKLVFDRRGSFRLTKEIIWDKLRPYCYVSRWHRDGEDEHNHLLLQCGAHFWLFLVTTTGNYNESQFPSKFDIKLIMECTDYSKQRYPFRLSIVDLYNPYINRWNMKYYGKSKSDPDYFRDIILTNDFRCKEDIVYSKSKDTKEDLKYPLLTYCGLDNLLDPISVFSAIEEHLSLERTESERTEPLGATNDDKIIIHGFDTKTSFRGK